MAPLTQEKMAQLIPLLGTNFDSELGRQFGLPRQRIFQLREARDIPPYKHEPTSVIMSTCMTPTDEKRTVRAMERLGVVNKSTYIRDAVKDKNRGVLGK